MTPPDTTTEIQPCPDCGYTKKHDAKCPQNPDNQLPPSAPRPSKVRTEPAEATTLPEVVITHAGPPAPEPVMGLRMHGPPGPLYGALARAQGAYQDLEKTGYNAHKDYHYAKLEDLLRATLPALSDAGLSVLQVISDGSQGETLLRTILGHESGSSLEATVTLPGVKLHGDSSGGVQALGSAITYMRRYSLQSILGVAGETDDDGAAAEKATPKATSKAKARNTGREGKGPVKQTAVFKPDGILNGSQRQRLEKGPWTEQEDESWTAKLTPVQVNSWNDILSPLGTLTFRGGDDE